jgi:hypothetical protein
VTRYDRREGEKRAKELLKGTPVATESYNAQRARQEAHRALPQGEQPWMVVYMGMLGYDVLWIAQDGSEESKRIAETEVEFWAKEFEKGMPMPGRTREPHRSDLQIRQQWDLDHLTRAILDSYQY